MKVIRAKNAAQLQRAVNQLSQSESNRLRTAVIQGRADTQPPKESASSCDCKSGVSSDEVRRLIDERTGNVNAGRVRFGSKNRYTPYSRQGGEMGKGGVCVSDSITVDDEASASESFSGVFSDNNLARMTGERVCAITALLSEDLQTQADRVMVSLTINGDILPSASRIPLDYIARTAQGEIQRVPVDITVPYDSVLGVQLEIVSDLEAAGADHEVRIRAEVGQDCPRW